MGMNVNKEEQHLVADKWKIKLRFCRRLRYFATGNCQCQQKEASNSTI
jgi:hypothetical protein